MQVLKVSSEKLLLIAGIVWCIAGLNIAFIGLGAYLVETGWLVWALVGGTLVVFVLFHVLNTKMVARQRIRATKMTVNDACSPSIKGLFP